MKTQPQTMAATMVPENDHKDIPGNPSTAKSSNVKLRQKARQEDLKVLTMTDW